MSIERNEVEKEGKPKSKAKKIILLSSLSAVVLIALAVVGMHFTSQPSFCASCHEMNSQVSAWSTGPHKDITCLSCHASPGTVGYVTAKINGLNQVYDHVTNQIPDKIEAHVDPAACIACHSGNNSAFPKAKNINLTSGESAPKMNHAPILQSNVSCVTCHKSVGHGQPKEAAKQS